MAVDLGTANTLVYVSGRGIVVSEPSVVAIDQQTDKPRAVGAEAKPCSAGRPAKSAIRPLKDGVIADFDVTIDAALFHPQGAQHTLGAPARGGRHPLRRDRGGEARRDEADVPAGARQAYPVEEPMAAAIGAGLPVQEPTGNMVVDIGGGTTEVAVISLGGIVVTTASARRRRDDEAVIEYARREHNLLIGERWPRPSRSRRLGVPAARGERR